MSTGLKRYNEIQKALSAQLKIEKSKGLSLKNSGVKFHEMASKTYRATKGQHISQVRHHIEDIVGGFIDKPIITEAPQFTSTQQDIAFYDFKQEVEGEGMPANLHINSFAFKEKEVAALDLDYDKHIQEFTTHCNKAFGKTWFDSSDAPRLIFTEPIKIREGYYLCEYKTDDPDNYGFVIGDDEADFVKPEEEEEIPEEEIEVTPVEETPTEEKGKKGKSKKAKAKAKAAKRAKAIKVLEIESKKEDNKAAKLSLKKGKQNLSILREYKELYKDGIITKADYRKKVMELKL